MNKNAVLVELLERSKAHSNGVSSIFKNTPIVLKGDFPSIEELQDLQQGYPDEFNRLIRFLYPEKFPKGTAGAFDWMTLVGGVLSGAGGLQQIGANQNGQSAAEAELAALKLQQQAQAEQKTEDRKWLIIGGVIAALVIVAIVIVVVRKK